MADNKTRPTGATVTAFLDGVEPAQRRTDALALDVLLRGATGWEPEMWGASIVGYGEYHYRYASGREGDMCRVGFSPRKSALVLYLAEDFPERDALLLRLGKHTTGTACLYIKKLADIDTGVLEDVIAASLAATARQYPQ